MCKILLGLLLSSCCVVSSWADNCKTIVDEYKLPVNLKTRGKPKVGKWEKVDEILNGVGKAVEKLPCQFAFGDLFRTKKEEELFFPLTNTVLRVVPEESLSGTEVFNKDGEVLGVFSNRFTYERSGGLQLKKSYSTYFFQFVDSAGKLQSVRRGNRLLLDDFVVRWVEIKDKLAVPVK